MKRSGSARNGRLGVGLPLLCLAALAGLPGDLLAQGAAPAVPSAPAAEQVRAAQKVKDFVRELGAGPVELKGEGVVIGLNGNGDSPGGNTEMMIRNFLANHRGDSQIATLNIKNVAAVIVTAKLPAYQKPGTTIDVRVSGYGDAKSLAGGTLLMTPMRSIVDAIDAANGGEVFYAVAQGRLITEGDLRTGNQTTGTIPGGAEVKREFPRQIVRRNGDGDLYITLTLRKPDYNLAGRIAADINTFLFRYVDPKSKIDTSLPVARTVDAGAIDVFIPGEEVWKEKIPTLYPGFDREPVLFLDRVLNIDVAISTVPRRAVVTLNDSTKTISWNAEVIVRPGRVRVGNLVVGRENQESTLNEILSAAGAAATDQKLVDIVRALDSAGLLEAEVQSQ